MIYIIGILALISMIAFFIHLFIIAYNKEQKEQDERILQLEKRLQQAIKNRDDEMSHIYDNMCLNNDDINELKKRIEKLERKKKSDKE